MAKFVITHSNPFEYRSPVHKALEGLINIKRFLPWNPPVSHQYGNRCAHSPNSVSSSAAIKLQSDLPPVVEQAIGFIEGYIDNPHILEFIELSRSSSRQTRSERREAIVQTLKTILHFLDLPSMKVMRFIRSTGELRPITLRDLHVYSGLSLSRFKRAWLTLVNAGLFESIPQYEKETSATGEPCFKGLPSIKYMRKSIFQHFGLDKSLEKTQQNKRMAAHKASKKRTRAQIKGKELERRATDGRIRREAVDARNKQLFGSRKASDIKKTQAAMKEYMASKKVVPAVVYETKEETFEEKRARMLKALEDEDDDLQF